MELHGKALPEGACAEDVRAFQLLYREHCEVSADPPDTPPPRGPLPTLTPPPPTPPSGYRGCDDQPAVHVGGDAVEDVLEVQPGAAQRQRARRSVSGG